MHNKFQIIVFSVFQCPFLQYYFSVTSVTLWISLIHFAGGQTYGYEVKQCTYCLINSRNKKKKKKKKKNDVKKKRTYMQRPLIILLQI